MGKIGQFIIPTRSKHKISHEHSYPIGAERVSQALALTPQIEKLVLHFRQDYSRAAHPRRYRVLRARYSSLYAEWAEEFLDAAGLPLFNEWEIEVFPVPRIYRHRIQKHILETGLSQVERWLAERAKIQHVGNDAITFFYDEEKEEFKTEHERQPQPSRKPR